MREKDKIIVQDVKGRLSEEIRDHVERLIVFGSRARGEAHADSDLDLIALVDKKTPEIEKALDDVAYEVMWDHDFDPIISLKVFSRSKFENSVARGLSFYKNIDTQGIVV
jgi:predicted nucleotidyltransferase